MQRSSDTFREPTRCLWITRQDPCAADSGELIYSGGLLRALAATGEVELTVVGHSGLSNGPGIPGVRCEFRGTIPRGRLRGIFSLLPSDAFRLGNRSQQTALRHWLETQAWDWVVIDQAACAWALALLPRCNPRPRLAYIAHNHEAPLRMQIARSHQGPLPLRLALRWDAWKYARMESGLCRHADLITAITPRDESRFRTFNPGKPVLCLPPGYSGPIPANDPPPVTAATPRRVVLAGAFEWIAKRSNLEAFLTASENPFRSRGVEFLVVGKADPAYFEALGRRHPWARFMPNVPSIDPFLADARIGLIPEALGGGFKLKALDYVFRGLPLAAIREALSGLPVDPDQDAITSGNLPHLAAAVVARIDDIGFLNGAAKRSLEACRAAFRWEDRGLALARALHHPLSS